MKWNFFPFEKNCSCLDPNRGPLPSQAFWFPLDENARKAGKLELKINKSINQMIQLIWLNMFLIRKKSSVYFFSLVVNIMDYNWSREHI